MLLASRVLVRRGSHTKSEAIKGCSCQRWLSDGLRFVREDF